MQIEGVRTELQKSEERFKSDLREREAAPISAMLHAVISASAQMDMIVAAGREKLFDPELEMFEAVIK